MSFDWASIATAIPDTLKSLFGIIDKSVTDKDKANEIKLSIVQSVTGTGSTHWLQANAFSVAMLINYGMVVSLSLLGRSIPEWSLLVALLWLAGPLLNGLSKDTIGRIMEFIQKDERRK